jgi:DNA-binding CsgD family transcriptional regulator
VVAGHVEPQRVAGDEELSERSVVELGHARNPLHGAVEAPRSGFPAASNGAQKQLTTRLRRIQTTVPARSGAHRRLPLHGERELVALIDLAYDAATERDRWPGVLEELAARLGCKIVGLNLQDMNRGRASVQAQFGADPYLSWIDRYESYYAPRNIFLSARPDLTFSGAIRNGEAIVPDREAVRTEYFNDFLRPLGVLHAIGMVPFRTGSVLALLSLMRPIGAPSFSDADFGLLARFMPHLQRAISIHRRLEAVDLARVAASEALDCMAFGVVILDAKGRVLFHNEQTRELLAQGDGLLLLRDGLSAVNPTEAATLRRLVVQACATGTGQAVLPGGALEITRPSGRRPLSLLVAPFRTRAFGLATELPAAVVFIGDAERKLEGIGEALRRLHGLTPAETVVATLLLEGRRTEELAEMLGISLLTARTHVKRVLAKVDVRSQAELVRVLLSGPAGVRLR